MVKNELQDGIMVFREIETESGSLEAIYLGPGGVFIHAHRFSAPDEAYVLLKDLFRVTRLQLYSETQGLYDPLSSSFRPVTTSSQIDAMAIEYAAFRGNLYFYTPEDLTAMCDRLKRADAYAKGWYKSETGALFIRRGDVFREVSDVNSERVYYLNLFGGTLGLHRFYMGKFFTGFLYLLTGGLALMGWGSDLLFLLLGAQYDKRKRILCPPKHRFRKILLVPFGLMASCLLFALLLFLYRTAAA